MGSKQVCWVLFWTNPIPQNSCYTATYLSFHKLSMLDEKHNGHCWRSEDELIGNLFLWTPTHIFTSVSQPASPPSQQKQTAAAHYIYIYIYIYKNMVVSVTLGFMLYAFIRVKGFQQRPNNMVNFLFHGGFFLSIFVANFVCFWMFAYMLSLTHTYVLIFVHVVVWIFPYIHIFTLFGRGGAKEESVRRKEGIKREQEQNCYNQNDFFICLTNAYSMKPRVTDLTM